MSVNNSVQVLLDNKKISNISFNENGMNSFGYENLNEVFFDVYEIKHKEFDLVKEKCGEFDGDPIVELDLCIENEIFKNVRFVLKKQNGIHINTNLLDYTNVVVFEKKNTIKKQPAPVIVQKPKKIIKEAVKKKIAPANQILKEEKLVERNKEEFFNSIKTEMIDQLRGEIKQGIIAEMLKENMQSNFNSLLAEDNNKTKLHRLFEQTNTKFRNEIIQLSEKLARRESMRFAESGGGTNAVQYANGGTMDGSLTITHDLSADTIIANNVTDTLGRELVSKLSFTINGDDTKNTYILNHNLNSNKILISVYDDITKEQVIPYVVNIDNNNTKVEFSNNLTFGENYLVIIFG